MCKKTKHSSKDCNRYLFIVNKIDILWSSWRTCLLIINFEQVRKPFLVWNIISLFSYQWLTALSIRVILRVTVYYYYVTYTSEAVVRRCSVENVFLEISQNSLENTCARVSFLNKVAGLLFLKNTSGGCFWRFRVNQHSIILELFPGNSCNTWILSEQ